MPVKSECIFISRDYHHCSGVCCDDEERDKKWEVHVVK